MVAQHTTECRVAVRTEGSEAPPMAALVGDAAMSTVTLKRVIPGSLFSSIPFPTVPERVLWTPLRKSRVKDKKDVVIWTM